MMAEAIIYIMVGIAKGARSRGYRVAFMSTILLYILLYHIFNISTSKILQTIANLPLSNHLSQCNPKDFY